MHELIAVLVRGLFAAQGLHVLDLARDLGDVVLDAERVSVNQAIPVLGGLAVLVSDDVAQIVLRDAGAEPLLAVAVSDLRNVAATDARLRDIALAVLSARIDRDERTPDQIAGLVVALVFGLGCLRGETAQARGIESARQRGAEPAGTATTQ